MMVKSYVDSHSFNVLSLCSGVGSLDCGIKLAVPNARTVCYVEREAYCCTVLGARFEDGSLDDAPIWDDLASFDTVQWAGRVDCIVAGIPCQPFSVAGKRGGLADDRWLWPLVANIIRVVRPQFAFLENVPGFVTTGIGPVLSDLAAQGYNAEWDVFSAAQVGASHRRERLFILAYTGRGTIRFDNGEGRNSQSAPEPDHENLADTMRVGLPRKNQVRKLGGKRPCEPGTLFPPGPNDRDAWDRVPPETKPAIRGMADGLVPRVDRLRALGNGVVPLAAAYAFRTLVARIGK